MPKHKPQELITQYAWNEPASLPLNVRLKAAKKSLLSQNVEDSMHCMRLHKKRARKTSVVQTDCKVTFQTTSSISLVTILVVFGFSTHNSNRTNHKLRKKLANQKRRLMSLRLCRIRTRYRALIRRRSIQKV